MLYDDEIGTEPPMLNYKDDEVKWRTNPSRFSPQGADLYRGMRNVYPLRITNTDETIELPQPTKHKKQTLKIRPLKPLFDTGQGWHQDLIT